MQSWGGGYVTDVAYEDGFYWGQSPTRLALICAINGLEPPELGDSFAYCELGCGRGTTILALAAAHPAAQFHAVDFNPAHIAHARARARAAGLTNVIFHELGFEALTGERAPALPMFDIVTMHGVWSWVSPALQEAILAFLDEKLVSGGLVYVSYNALPGWSGAAPLQRLIKELAGESAARSDLAAEQAIARVMALGDANAIPDRMREGLARIQGTIRDGRFRYLAHEYLNEHWRPVYHLDVARAFGAAKLSFAGASDVIRNFENMVMTGAQHELVAQVASPSLRETLKDFCGDRSFRTDVFVRGERRLTPERRQALLRNLRLTLLRHPPEAFHLTLADGSHWRPDPRVYLPALQALKERPCRVSELLTLPDVPPDHTVDPGELIGILVGADLAAVYTAPSSAALAAAARLNAETLSREHERGWMLAVPAIDGALPFNPIDRALLVDVQRGLEPDAEDLARRFIELCHAGGGHPIVDGRVVEDEAEGVQLLTADYEQRIAGAIPLWRMLHLA